MKKINLLVLLAATPLLLTSCDKISAKFLGGDAKLTNVETQRNVSIDHNTLDVIYKKIKDGGTYTSDVKDLLSRALAKEVLGDYRVVSNGLGSYEIKIMDLEEGTLSTEEWIKKHSAYKNWASSDYKLSFDDGDVSLEDFNQRIQIVKDLVDKQMLSTLWGEANTASYKRNNRFYEVQFAKSIYDKLYKVTKADGKTALTDDEIDALFDTPDYDTHYVYSSGVFDGFQKDGGLVMDTFTNGALIDYNYTAETELGRALIRNTLHVSCYLDYINSTIIPTIMSNLLVEQYILQEQYNAIGSSQTRKVDYIKIDNNEAKNAENFLTKVINESLFAAEDIEDVSDSFVDAQEAWKGVSLDIKGNEVQEGLAGAIFGQPTQKNKLAGKEGHSSEGAYIENYATIPFEYYDNTEYADLLEKYATLTRDLDTNNSSNTTSFTTIDNINYSPIVGLEIKTDEIRVKNFQTYGWQAKDNSSIPELAKKKLYSYGFINEWNESLTRNSQNNKNYEGSYIYQPKAGGVRFLMKDAYTSKSDAVLWQDGSSFYVIAIEDVVTPETIALEGTETAEAKHAIETKARTAAYTLASGSTYTTNALTHYLKDCNIEYNDQDVYDYFVSNFPKLFE